MSEIAWSAVGAVSRSVWVGVIWGVGRGRGGVLHREAERRSGRARVGVCAGVAAAGPEFGTGDRNYAPLTDYPRGPTPHRCTARGGVAHAAKRYHDANKGRDAHADNPRWARVLAAFGATLPDAPYNTVEPLTVAEAQAQEAHWTGWTPIRIELERIETCRSAPCQQALALNKGQYRDSQIRQHCPGVLD